MVSEEMELNHTFASAGIRAVDRQVSQMTREAMAGALDFNEAIRRRVRLLKGLSEDKLEMLARSIGLTPAPKT